MEYMFHATGYKSTVFTLDLGDKFNTSKVTNMFDMFNRAGFSSPVFTLDLGSKFDTSKVTDMAYMFYQTGYANNNFVLDLCLFTFDNVTTYTNMFYNFKTTQKIYVKNTSDQTWITSKGFSNVTSSNVLVKS